MVGLLLCGGGVSHRGGWGPGLGDGCAWTVWGRRGVGVGGV